MKYLRWVLAGIILSTILMVPSKAQSNETIGLTIFPAIVEVGSLPGETHQVQLTVENTSSRALPVVIEANELIPIDDEIDKNRRSEFDASTWVQIPEPNQVFGPGDVKSFTFDIVVPKKATPGGHYALIGVRALSEAEQIEDTTAKVSPELGMSLFVTVAGDIQETAEIEGSNILRGSRITKGDLVNMEFSLRNTGNVHIFPAPRISILKDGKPIETFSLNPQVILPNTEKRFTVEWLADVNYGSYQVIAETVYGSQSIPLATQPIGFQVWPPLWQIIAVLGSVLILLSILIRWQNIPKALAILKGRAAGVRGSFKRSAGDEDLPTQNIESDIDDVSAEIKQEMESKTPPVILGFPDSEDTDKELEKAETKQNPKPKSKSKAKPKKKTAPKEDATVTELKESDSLTKTVIIQTSATTIVREEIDDTEKKQETSEPTVIKVLDADEAKKKPKKKTPAKKTAPKKKPAKSSSRNKKAAKKSTAKKKSPTKKKSTTKKKTPTKKQGSKAKSSKKKK